MLQPEPGTHWLAWFLSAHYDEEVQMPAGQPPPTPSLPAHGDAAASAKAASSRRTGPPPPSRPGQAGYFGHSPSRISFL